MQSKEILNYGGKIESLNLEIIADLKNQEVIKRDSPVWWSTEYSADPRELLNFEEYKKNLVSIGTEGKTGKELFLYPKKEVPMTFLDLNIDGKNLKFLITSRPYHEKEKESQPFIEELWDEKTIDDLRAENEMGKRLKLLDQLHPHIRGLFVSQRGSHFFWYPIEKRYLEQDEFSKKITRALSVKNLSFIDVGAPQNGSRTMGNINFFNEINCMTNQKYFDLKKLAWPNFDFEKVSTEEFLKNYQDNKNLVVLYPLVLPQFKNTLTLVVSNKTNEESKISKPAILGTLVDNGADGFCNRTGIARIKDKTLSEEISLLISKDFGVEVNTVLFTPQKGRPKYERVTG